MSKQKVFWKKIHEIQSNHNCDVATARRILRNGKEPAPVATLTPDARPETIVAFAKQKAKELEGKINQTKDQVEAMQSELELWRSIQSSIETVEARGA